MHIRPSVAQSYKHLILRYLSLRVYTNILHILFFFFSYISNFYFLNKYWNFVCEVTYALHKSFFL
jgi:hypothetical protein